MYKINNNIWLLIIAFFAMTAQSCNDDDDAGGPPNVEAPREKQFVWEGMNSWYLWQSDVPNLSNDVRTDASRYSALLNSASDPEILFNNLRTDGNTDRFSFITDDYVALANSFQGISTSYGYEFGLVRFSGSENIFGWVRYVLPGSPAENAGIVRGDLFTEVNGTTLNINNFRDLLFGLESYTLTLASIQGGAVTPTGETATMTSVEITENPVLLSKTIDLANGKKVGYLMYNSFVATFHSELNAVFADFKSQGVDDLVLDLRYNGGGSVLTSQYLSSMIYEGNPDLIFGNIDYNSKHTQFNSQIPFANEVELKNADFQTIGTQPLNSLGLNSVYVLVSGGTASASELVINALQPFISVNLIGNTTVGKNVGSITLYDAPGSDYTDRASANPNHLWAMQPIVSIFSNAINQSDYTAGFEPSIVLDELDFLADFKPLGDPSEPFLAAALSQICPSCRLAGTAQNFESELLESIGDSNIEDPLYQEMYLNGLFD